MNIIVSDFDDTLFKRNHGLIEPVVSYLEQKGLPVYIVTYRDSNQYEFISEVLSQTKLKIIGYAFASSRKKDSRLKLSLIQLIAKDYTIKEVLDDDTDLVLLLKQRGFAARQP